MNKALAGCIGALFLLAAVGALPAAAQEAVGAHETSGTTAYANPQVTVSVTQGLADGQTVTVTGSGFCKAGDRSCDNTYGLEMCRVPVRGMGDCDQDPLGGKLGRTDANGGFTRDVPLKQKLTLPDNTTVDCTAAGNCAVGASNFNNPNQAPSAAQVIAFSGAPAAAGKTASTVPAATGANRTEDALAQPGTTASLSMRAQLMLVGLVLAILAIGMAAGYFVVGRRVAAGMTARQSETVRPRRPQVRLRNPRLRV